MKKSSKKYYGFTLVELIIVITILAILSTIAFVSFQGYTKSSRDSVRLSNLSNIEKSLEVFNVKSGTYPTPDNKINISLSGSDVSFQGTLGDKSSSILGFGKTPTDPLDNSNYFYSTNTTGKSYSLVSFAENQTSFVSNQALADNSNKSTLTKGNLSYLLDANNNTLTSDTDLFGNGSGASFVQVLNNTTKLTGSGIELGGGFQMLALGNGNYSSPTICPEGFIPVIGSADFSQPGFCVAKYEMSYGDNTLPNTPIIDSQNTVTFDTNKTPVSKAGYFPIAQINQSDAINSCKKMGVGYHLITNNEWMTIARQIENIGVNWSGGVVGVNNIFNGISNSNLGCNGQTDSIYTGLPRNWATKTGGGFGNDACDKKRQLTLSNGEIIWDFIGNVREHVNKINSFSGDNNNFGINNITTYTQKQCPRDTTNTGCFELNNISSSNTKITNLYSLNKNFNSSNGMGMGYKPNGINNNIFIRGGCANDRNHAGIYTTDFNETTSISHSVLGFRCAYIKQ